MFGVFAYRKEKAREQVKTTDTARASNGTFLPKGSTANSTTKSFIRVGDRVKSNAGSVGVVMEFGRFGEYDTRIKKSDGKIVRCDRDDLTKI